METHIIYFSIALLTTIYFIYKYILATNNNKNQPPSPPSFPILGHLHLFKPPYHRTLLALARRYGPIISLRLGRKRVIVISSAWAAKECFTQHDIVLADRPKLLTGQHFGYNHSVLIWAPYGDHWRNLRRVTTLLVFSGRRINEAGQARKMEINDLIKQLLKKSRSKSKVNLNVLFEKITRNFVMRVVNGRKWDEYEFKTPPPPLINVCDCLPVLRWVGYRGEEKRMIQVSKERDNFFQNLIEEVRKKRRLLQNGGVDGEINKTMIDQMLDLQQHDPHYYTDHILKGILMILLLAGSPTSSRALEYAMSLILSHPETLKKAKKEMDTKVGNDRIVDDNDLPKLSYITNIVNETLRLFPPAPLLLPHSSSRDCVIGGYHVKKDTIILVNTWALHRDPELWDEPNKFKPERFENEKEGFKFMPFGIGRRSCPGNNFALRNVSLTLATIIQCFDFEIEKIGVVDSIVDENSIVMPEAKPLEVVFHPRSNMIDVLSGISRMSYYIDSS